MPGKRAKTDLMLALGQGKAWIAAAPAGKPRQAVWREMDLDPARLGEPEVRQGLVEALEECLSRAGGGACRGFVSLADGLAFLGHREPNLSGEPDPEELSSVLPLAGAEVYWDLRPPLDGHGPDEILAAPRPLVDELVEAAREAGVEVQALDCESDYLALAWAGLGLGGKEGLVIHLAPGRALWAVLAGGKPVARGAVPAGRGEKPTLLARRALQEGVLAVPGDPGRVYLLGEGAAEAAAELAGSAPTPADDPAAPPAPAAADLQAPSRGEVLPPDLPWRLAPLWGFLARVGRKGSTLANLWPVKPPPEWLETRRATVMLLVALGLVLVIWGGQGYWDDLLAYDAAQSRLGQVRQELREVRAQKEKLKARFAGLKPLLDADQAQQRALAVLGAVAENLPDKAHLEKLEYDQAEVKLTVVGTTSTALTRSFKDAGILSIKGRPQRGEGYSRTNRVYDLTLAVAGHTPAAGDQKPSRATRRGLRSVTRPATGGRPRTGGAVENLPRPGGAR